MLISEVLTDQKVKLVGQKVKFIGGHYSDGRKVKSTPSFTLGNVYTISGWDRHHVLFELDDKGSTTNGWNPKFFELVTEIRLKDIYAI